MLLQKWMSSRALLVEERRTIAVLDCTWNWVFCFLPVFHPPLPLSYIISASHHSMCWGYKSGQKKALFKENVDIAQFVQWKITQIIKRTRKNMLTKPLKGLGTIWLSLLKIRQRVVQNKWKMLMGQEETDLSCRLLI